MYDTQNLQLFVWNNNAWVTAMSPLSNDIVIAEALSDIQALKAKPDITSSTTAPAILSKVTSGLIRQH